MATVKLANILLEQNKQALAYPAMWYKSDRCILPADEPGTWELCECGTTDFTTYFNAAPTRKLRLHTVATRLLLHLELRGAACTVTPTKAGTFAFEPERVPECAVSLPASDQWSHVDVEMAFDDTCVLSAFELSSDDTVWMRNAYYYVEIPGEAHDVELALVTTTFRKESYVLSNIDAIRRGILESGEDAARHFHMHVVDNARTLDAHTLDTEGITVHPNDNVGGAGGFARGMIEALGQDVPATHVLLMDDDVIVAPESILRTYNLLRILDDDHAEAFISGAMLTLETPDLLWEDLGYLTPEGTCMPVKPAGLHMTSLPDVLLSETYEPSDTQRAQMYAAWWYCCIPASVIRRAGLPLPVFVRFDDIEYSLRAKPKFITMNGIGIWHMMFWPRYNAAVERYQTTRNSLVAQSVSGIAPGSDFVQKLRRDVFLELRKFNYADAELALDGFEDFLKGPGYIRERGVAERRFMDANHAKEKLESYDAISAQVMALLGVDIHTLRRQDVDEDVPRSRAQAALDRITCNGQRTLLSRKGSGCGVITSLGFVCQPGRIHGKRALVAVDYANSRGAVRMKDAARCRAILARCKQDLKAYRQQADSLRKQYADARSELTSVAFWRHYLRLDDSDAR